MKENTSIEEINDFDKKKDKKVQKKEIRKHIFNFKDFSSIINIEKDCADPKARYKYVDIKAKVMT
tara:strand:- start:165 stop:359 length:195 start_codon:yes stop_codon:yes gene_type:complete